VFALLVLSFMKLFSHLHKTKNRNQNHHQDAILFEAIISDLFPSTQPPAPHSAPLRAALARVLTQRGLQPAEGLVGKGVQLEETLGVRFGVMLVGQAGEGLVLGVAVVL